MQCCANGDRSLSCGVESLQCVMQCCTNGDRSLSCSVESLQRVMQCCTNGDRSLSCGVESLQCVMQCCTNGDRSLSCSIESLQRVEDKDLLRCVTDQHCHCSADDTHTRQYCNTVETVAANTAKTQNTNCNTIETHTVYSRKAGCQKGISPSKLTPIVDLTRNRDI